MPGSGTVIALDIGHSAVKLIAAAGGRRERILFPSVVTPAFGISEESAARAASLETVNVRGRDYFFGRTAVVQGGAEVETGMSENWIHETAHLALALGAMKKLAAKVPPFELEGATVVFGLPAKFYAKQRSILKDMMQPHLPHADIRVLPQPLGPYFAIQFDDAGNQNRRRNTDQEAWAIVEVGHFTTDFALTKAGDWVERCSGSCVGASSATQQLQRMISERTGRTVSLLDATRAMETGEILIRGEAINLVAEIEESKRIFSDEVIPFAQRLWDRDAWSLNGVIVAGGGARLVRDAINATFGSAIDSEDSRFAVAEGFVRAGLHAQRTRQLAAQRQAAAATEA